jgi:hypothetical protein
LTDMVSICKHLQYRKQAQAKMADRLDQKVCGQVRSL